MEKNDPEYINCAHCGVKLLKKEAVDYKHRLLYGEHYHCNDCDPKGVWDCISHDTDMDVH